MGLKSGSRDSGLDDEAEDERAADAGPTDETTGGRTPAKDEPASTGGTDDRPAMDAIPYKLRRDRVNEGREQVPYFLREEVIEGEDDLQDTLEDLLGEDVYKSDYREAAMVVAQRNPELVAEVLREWGYDLDAR